MTTITNVSRRGFLKGLAGTGGLLLAAQLVPVGASAAVLAGGTAGLDDDFEFTPSVWLSIDADGLITIIAHRSEMGTGIRSVLPAVLADELGADITRVRIQQATGDRRYIDQNTDGSRSIRQFFDVMREAGASARLMLEDAAASTWDVNPAECKVVDHQIVHEPSGRTLEFGDVVEVAAGLTVPEPGSRDYRSPKEWRYIGKDVPNTDMRDITGGTATFGFDARLDGMLIASIEHCPVLGGKAERYDEQAALAVPGVERVIEIPRYLGAPAFQPLGGVAIVARDTWSALKGREALAVEWDLDGAGDNASYDSDAYWDLLHESVRKPGNIARERGDVDAALAGAAMIVEAEYDLPHLAHASMEPPCALARVDGDTCEVWAPTQNPMASMGMVARTLGLQPADVTIHVTLLGGGFGRKSKPDYVVEAALLAAEMGAPVKVVWTREDDIRHDYLHAVSAIALKAGLDTDGKPIAWLGRTAFPSIGATFDPGARFADPGQLSQGFTDVPYDIPAIRVENGEAPAHVRIGWLRSVCNIFHAFAVCSFADELAAARQQDPLDSLIALIGPDRLVDLGSDNVQYPNYGESAEDHPIDTARLKGVIRLAAEQAGWGRELPRGRGLGLAVHRSFACYVAQVVEVDVTKDGKLDIPRVVTAVDCGLAVSPDRVRAQMEGAAVFGTSLALYGEITAKAGAVQQGNFDDYKLARMNSAPRRIDVHIVASDAPPGGVGEPGVPPFAPALCNAIFAATGQRIRRLPISRHDLSWS